MPCDDVASLGYRRQCKSEEGGEVVSNLAGLEQGAQVLLFVVVVIIGQADHDPIVDARLPQHKSFQSPGSATVSIAKRVHCSNMVMGGHGLNNAVVFPELSPDGVAEGVKSITATVSTSRAPAAWRPEGDIVLEPPECSGLAVVVFTTSNDAPVDFQYELTIDGTVLGLGINLFVGRFGCP